MPLAISERLPNRSEAIQVASGVSDGPLLPPMRAAARSDGPNGLSVEQTWLGLAHTTVEVRRQSDGRWVIGSVVKHGAAWHVHRWTLYGGLPTLASGLVLWFTQRSSRRGADDPNKHEQALATPRDAHGSA
jgi:hypothetical protein